ncbi:MAG: aminotransferase [Thalassobaculum sp.]|uniref:aminotransferase n=1 Tax=Thalassobaculum sp. TaxID=2022740 RepID=UPI0032EE0E0D
MPFAANPDVVSVVEPPIAEAKGWVAGRTYPAHRPLLDLCQAVPSYPPAEELRAHLAERVRLFETAQYTAITGIAPLREALAEHMAGVYGGSIDADNVLVTGGCNQAYTLALMALARRGDEVILPLPYYFNHQMWLDALGVTARHLPFRPDRGGVPDPADAVKLIGPNTRALVLVTPNNPTGAVIPPDVLAQFRDVCAEYGIALVLDETYKDFLDPGEPRHGLFRDPAWGDTVIQLYSFSKAFSLTGYRVGSIVAGAGFVDQVAKLMDTVSICASRIAQDGALYALRHLLPWADGKRAMMAGRREALLREFESGNLGFELVSTGAYFAYLRHPFVGETAAAVAKRLAQEHGVLALPGTVFGPGQDPYLRLAFANLEAERMGEVGDRLRGAV